MRDELEISRSSVAIDYFDPLQRHLDHSDHVAAVLTEACNYVGTNVIVEGGVTLIGGKFACGVGIRLGDNVRIYSGSHLVVDQVDERSGIELGPGVSLNYNCYIEGSGGVTIGPGTIIGPNVVILSSRHNVVADQPITRSGKTFQPVSIGGDVWIGANVVVMPGLVIGDCAVLGAGAIVTRSVPERSVVAGNPARPLS
ncbi:MAG TPA: DapH/DapD/GlmU-related protein [Acidimicrobiales bacterium]|nr:DapH/DapD/GlmU-related protein [Acidimicrobiales bacterium]